MKTHICEVSWTAAGKKRPSVIGHRRSERMVYLKEKYIWGFRRVGFDCGRDSTGTFHCVCGKCAPLRIDVSKGGKYRGDDCGDGRYEGEKYIDYVSSLCSFCP